jgi:hypothetical protein
MNLKDGEDGKGHAGGYCLDLAGWNFTKGQIGEPSPKATPSSSEEVAMHGRLDAT